MKSVCCPVDMVPQNVEVLQPVSPAAFEDAERRWVRFSCRKTPNRLLKFESFPDILM